MAQPPAWAIKLAASGRFALLTACAADADSMDGAALERATAEAYHDLASQMRRIPALHAVRIWNFLPRILDREEQGLERYMRFNAGRYRSFTRWLGGAETFDDLLPAASAVGHSGSDLLIYALAYTEPAKAVTNPRQCPPHRYSRRYGPLPPCFARATLVREGDRNLLMVGGTASVRGEQTVHVGNLPAQLAETFENLAAVAQQAYRVPDGADPLGCYRELRVYFVRRDDVRSIESAVSQRFGSLRHAEFIQADLCRRDLLAEIEGLGESAPGEQSHCE